MKPARRPRKSRQPRKAYHHGDLRRSLIEAAVHLLRTQGVEGLTLRAVARQAEVSHAAPYHHFASRDQLLEAVAETGFVELRQAVVAHLQTVDPTTSVMIQEAGVGYVLFAFRNPAVYRVMFGAALAGRAPSEPLKVSAEAAYELIHHGIAMALEGRDVPVETGATLARTCWSLVHGLASLAIDGHLGELDETTIEAQARAVTGVLEGGFNSAASMLG